MPIDPQLLEILACPQDKGPLYYLADEDTLYNPRLKRRYAVREGIPVLLVGESEKVSGTEHARIMAKVEAQGLKPTFAPAEPGDNAEPGPSAGRD